LLDGEKAWGKSLAHNHERRVMTTTMAGKQPQIPFGDDTQKSKDNG
jgi:hypothetical protein